MGEETKTQNAEFHIILNQETGQVSVNGPLPNTMLCLGMLEMAKMAVIESRAKESMKAAMAQRNFGIIPMGKNGKR
jgi:hypothetical protein